MYSNKIRIKTGTEGPQWDPYGYTEITIDGRNGKVTIHSGLGEWVKVNDKIVAQHGECDQEFERLTGVHPHIAEQFYYRMKARPQVEHLRRCRAEADSVAGYPGETFVICGKCKEILDTHFDERAVI